MDYRLLGASGLKVPALSFGTGTFGGSGPLFGAWGNTDVTQARRLIDICLEAGVTLFDTADVYSDGASEAVLGEALKGRRGDALISTKLALPTGDGPNDWGTSRARLIASVEKALTRLQTDHIACCNCTLSMPARRSRRFSRRWTTWCAQASCVMSASPIFPAGR